MPIFSRLHAKHLTQKYVGKSRRFQLTRNESSVRFSGTLLAVYRISDEDEEHQFPGLTRLALLALFKTKSGRYLAYYAVDHEGNEHIDGRREYLKVCESFDALEDFVGRMRYVNAERFQPILLQAKNGGAPAPQTESEAVPEADPAPEPEPALSPPAAGA